MEVPNTWLKCYVLVKMKIKWDFEYMYIYNIDSAELPTPFSVRCDILEK